MSLQTQINEEIKNAMKANQPLILEALRAIKTALLLEQTQSGAKDELSKEQEIKLLQKLVKQRKESAKIYTEQGREDLAQPELEQAKIIEKFLPTQLSKEEIKEIITQIIAETKANGIAQMGQIIGLANKKIAGQADGKTISEVVKTMLA